MGRIATAQGGNNPSTYSCGICGLTGHNRRNCGITKPLPSKGSKKCSVCGKLGHNKRTCPTLLEKQFELEVAKVELTCLLCDEEPMESDLELTPTPRSEVGTPDTIPFPDDQEVEIYTEGYRNICGLNHDLMLMVGEEVGKIRVKINQDWWEGKIHFTSWDGMDKSYFHITRSRSAMGVIGQAPTILSIFEVDRMKEDGWQYQKVIKQIHTAVDLLEDKGKVIKPSHLKYKYIRHATYNPWVYTWRHSLRERAERIEDERLMWWGR